MGRMPIIRGIVPLHDVLWRGPVTPCLLKGYVGSGFDGDGGGVGHGGGEE